MTHPAGDFQRTSLRRKAGGKALKVSKVFGGRGEAQGKGEATEMFSQQGAFAKAGYLSNMELEITPGWKVSLSEGLSEGWRTAHVWQLIGVLC